MTMKNPVRDSEWHEGLVREYERLQFAREQFLDSIDGFPPNPRYDLKRKNMERHMRRIKMTIQKYD
jgi:hypothetical protein